MNPSEITRHLERYREKQERIASEEIARLKKEEETFRANCLLCQATLRDVVEPMLAKLSELLAEHGHKSIIHPVQDYEHITERTRLKSMEYATALAVDRPKGPLILRIVASPQPLQVSSYVGIPHGNCSSVFNAASGPLSEAEEVTNRGIADFMTSAFPLR
jgi:hypothetical protein